MKYGQKLGISQISTKVRTHFSAQFQLPTLEKITVRNEEDIDALLKVVGKSKAIEEEKKLQEAISLGDIPQSYSGPIFYKDSDWSEENVSKLIQYFKAEKILPTKFADNICRTEKIKRFFVILNQ